MMKNFFKRLRQYASIYLVQFHNNWVREAVYRTNFLTMLVVDIVWIVVEFSLFSVIYMNTTTIAGWTKEQTYFFLGLLFASDALFTIFFARNFWMFSDLVNKGDLDIILTKPVHPLFIALTRWMSISTITNFALGCFIVIKFAGSAGFVFSAKSFFLILFWMFVSLSTAALLRFAFSAWVFWTDRSWALSRMYYHFFHFATKPDGLYPPLIRYTMMTILPFAFIGSVPARALLKGLKPWEYALVICVLALFATLDGWLWKRGLARYQSASS